MMAKAKKVEKTNNKNLITIVLLIVAGIVILSYTNSTGFVTKSTRGVTSMEVSPTEVQKGDILKVTIKAGAKGYTTPIEIRRVGDGIQTDKIFAQVNVGSCKSTANTGCRRDAIGVKKTVSSEKGVTYYVTDAIAKNPGKYYVKTTDFGTKNVIKVYFDVV